MWSNAPRSPTLPTLIVTDSDVVRKDVRPVLSVLYGVVQKVERSKNPPEFYIKLKLSDSKSQEFDTDAIQMIDRIRTQYSKEMDSVGPSVLPRDTVTLLENFVSHKSSNEPNDGNDRETLDYLRKILKQVEDVQAYIEKAATVPQARRSAISSLLKPREQLNLGDGRSNVSNISGLPVPMKGLKAGRRKSRKLGNTFNRCVKSVRSTVRARKGSNKESAAIAICTKSVLHTRGKTMKRYRKGRLITQKKFRGGCWDQGTPCS